MLDYKWIVKNVGDNDIVYSLSKSINVSKWISNLLVQRGIDDFEKAKSFFRPNLEELHNPFFMKDMDKAVERLISAIHNNEKILIYGDYDVDGTTSVALVYSFLDNIYPNIEYYIPDRYNEGYGVSEKGILYAEENEFKLIITLDCGIRSVEKVDFAASKGIDFIICDHHLEGDKLPNAVAVLDPKRKDCEYPDKGLSGCGVGFKFMQAFCIQNGIDENELFQYLDLLCISIAADIVPIKGENRIFAFYGLKEINSNPRPGIQSLIKLAGFDKSINITNVVFGFAPRINAAGRIDHAHKAVELLLSKSLEAAEEIAILINQNNTDRKDFDKSITEEALEMINDNPKSGDSKTTVLFKKNWHKGVVGIVASRCIENYYKPTIILTESNGLITGSARSVEGFDIHQAISECEMYLDQYGGHPAAAGLTLKHENLELFKNAFENAVEKSITKDQLIPKIEIDSELELNVISWKFYNVLKQLAPFGPGNMRPVFVSKGVVDTGKSKIVGDNHLKLSVSQDDSNHIDGIAFGFGEYYDQIKNGNPFDIVYSIEENKFRGSVKLQLQIRDIKLV